MNFSKSRIEKIRAKLNELSYKFSKSKINESRRNLYEIEHEKNLFAPKIKDIEKKLLELEKNIFKNSSTIKINKHSPSGYSLLTHCSFHTTKNKLDYYRGKDCMRNFCLDLKEHATKIINYEKKRNNTINKRKKENTS